MPVVVSPVPRQFLWSRSPDKAGEGSRTLVNSLEGYGSTVELHPRFFLPDTRAYNITDDCLVGGAGFEPAKALPSDLQSDPFDRSGNPPSSYALRRVAPTLTGRRSEPLILFPPGPVGRQNLES